MSQYPPPPPGAWPQDQPAGAYPPARPSNGPAITSLVLGLLLCIPVLTGIGAVVFGFIGIRNARDPRIPGKASAIAGLVLGIINILFWIFFGGAIWALVAGTGPQREAAKAFITEMSEGDIKAAAARCHSTMSESSLRQSSAAMQAWGKLQDVTTVGINANAGTGVGNTIQVTGVAKFANAQRQFHVIFAKENGVWKIVEYQFP